MRTPPVLFTQGRYREMLVITDTCQAATLMRLVSNRAVSDLSSSKRAENSYSYNLGERLIVQPG